jgi:cyclic pyranopterin phosphate synthase
MRDSFGRSISYLRLSVTDRCDFRCSYCLPRSYRGFASPDHWMRPDEVERLVKLFSSLGIRHVRLTGGEPLVRKELLDISRRIHALEGIEEISLSTNAGRLGPVAAELRESGVSRLNISLDTLNGETFKQITGSDLNPVLEGIDAAINSGFQPIKINMVVMRGVNDHEVAPMVAFCMNKGLTLRFIETMPVGQNGREAVQKYLPLSEIEQRLRGQFDLQPTAIRGSGPARYFRVDKSALVIGFITPQSQHFCESCNRVRLSVEGNLHLCLGQENQVPLGKMLREGASDGELREAIIEGIRNKPERHHFEDTGVKIIRPMSALGG